MPRQPLAPVVTRRGAKRVARPEGRRPRCAEAAAAGGARRSGEPAMYVWRRTPGGGKSPRVLMNTTELPTKKDVMLAFLERSSVFIRQDQRREGVRVQLWFKKQPQLVLQVGLNMAVRIPDLDVGEDAVSCTLSFSRSPFFCYIPWTSVFALVAEDGKAGIWPNDIPPEVAAQQAERAQKEQARERIRPVAE